MNRKERTDNERLSDISYQLARVADELRAIREVIAANGEYYIDPATFNSDIAKKLTKDD